MKVDEAITMQREKTNGLMESYQKSDRTATAMCREIKSNAE